jgi:hypothetical protein
MTASRYRSQPWLRPRAPTWLISDDHERKAPQQYALTLRPRPARARRPLAAPER